MELYLLKFSGCLLVFWAVYVLLLEKQKMHNFKRFYLLGAFLVALIIPLITVTYYVEPVIEFGTFDPNTSATPSYFPEEIATITKDTSVNYLPTILWSIYAIGVLVFSIRFISNLVTLYKRISKNETIKQHPFIYVLMQHYHIPHSFFNYIFFSKSKFDIGDIPREVILHEETHAKQFHSLDIVAVELLQIAFWFHPLVYVLKHHIKLNHEFLADQAVLDQGTDTKNYQHILLQFSSNTSNNQLASAINYSSIKKRFTVMKTQTSKRKFWASIALILPISAVLFYSFSSKEYVEKAPPSETAQNQFLLSEINENEATEELMTEYKTFITTLNNEHTVNLEKYDRAIIIYDEIMSDNQRKSVEKYPTDLAPKKLASKMARRNPTKKEFEFYKSTKEYTIWVDGKEVSKSELNNYDYKDFVHVSGAIIYGNDNSEKFTQKNQYHLYTENGFKKTYQYTQVNKYKSAELAYNRERELFLNGFIPDISELKILKAKADKIYNTLSKSDIFSNALNPVPPIPTSKNSTKTSNYPETGFVMINNALYFYVLKNKQRRYYNSRGFETDSSGKPISKTQVNASDVIEGNYVKEVFKDNKVVVTFRDNWDDNQKEKYFQQIKDIKIGKSDVLINGKNCNNCNFNINEILDLKLSTKNSNVISSFSVKIMGQPILTMKGNMLNSDLKKYILDGEALYPIQIMNVKVDGKPIDYSSLIFLEDIKTKPTQTELNKYNDWVKEINRKVLTDEEKEAGGPFIDINIWQYYKSIQNRMSATQLEASESFPSVILNQKPVTNTNRQNPPTAKEIAKYNAWAKKINGETKIFSDKAVWYPPIDSKIIEFDGIYQRMTVKQKENSAKFPYDDIILKSAKLDFQKTATYSAKQNPPTAKEIREYNIWAKKISTEINTAVKNKSNEYPIIKLKDLERYKSILSRMSKKQKENAESFPNIDIIPIPKPHPGYKSKSKGGPNANQQAMIDFLKKVDGSEVIFTHVDAQKGKYASYHANLSLNEAIKLVEQDSKMKLYPTHDSHSGLVILISNNAENMIPKLTANNKVEHIQHLRIIGAKYYLNGEELTAKKAIKYVKRNPNVQIESTITPPTVNIQTGLANI